MKQVKVSHLCKYRQVGTKKTNNKPKTKATKTTSPNSSKVQDE